MPYTVSRIINLSLKDAGIIGIGQTPNAEDSNDALTRLNWMIDGWARKRWLIYVLETTSKVSNASEFYTVGPSGDYNVSVRPDKLNSAYLRQINVGPNPVDYPLEIITAREDYNLISIKNLVTLPTYVYYQADFPLGKLFPWPIPNADIYEIFITYKKVLSEFSAQNQVIELPPEYFEALHTNLSVILRDAYDMPPKPVLVARAKTALNTIRNANAMVPRLQLPSAILNRKGVYNIYSDTSRGG